MVWQAVPQNSVEFEYSHPYIPPVKRTIKTRIRTKYGMIYAQREEPGSGAKNLPSRSINFFMTPPKK
jgi:hypothetical protein